MTETLSVIAVHLTLRLHETLSVIAVHLTLRLQ